MRYNLVILKRVLIFNRVFFFISFFLPFLFIPCCGPKGPTPEQLQATQDSIAKAHGFIDTTRYCDSAKSINLKSNIDTLLSINSKDSLSTNSIAYKPNGTHKTNKHIVDYLSEFHEFLV